MKNPIVLEGVTSGHYDMFWPLVYVVQLPGAKDVTNDEEIVVQLVAKPFKEEAVKHLEGKKLRVTIEVIE